MIPPEGGKRRNLGRGLSALLGDEQNDYARLEQLRAARTLSVDQLRPGRFQPRRLMSEAGLDELARSISESGVLQPLLVRRHPEQEGIYEIIAGERRWRAAQRAQVHEVPVVVKDLTDGEALQIALVENLQRQDLSPLEEAEGYRRLMEEFSHTQDDLARSVSKSRSHIANMMRLLSLPEPVKAMIDEGRISPGHGRALLAAADPVAAADLVLRRGLSVRQTESLVQGAGAGQFRRRVKAIAKTATTEALEHELSSLLGLPVEITFRGRGGKLTLHYRSIDQLDDILQKLSQGKHGGNAAMLPAPADGYAAAIEAAGHDALELEDIDAAEEFDDLGGGDPLALDGDDDEGEEPGRTGEADADTDTETDTDADADREAPSQLRD